MYSVLNFKGYQFTPSPKRTFLDKHLWDDQNITPLDFSERVSKITVFLLFSSLHISFTILLLLIELMIRIFLKSSYVA